MNRNATTKTEATDRRLPFSDLPGFSSLFATYCTDFSRLADYFAGDWRDPEARRAAADRAAGTQRDRDTLVSVLLEQNARWGLDHATREHIEALRGNETVAVVTGQQVGLLTGPLYTPLKTLTTLQLARQLADETGRPVVPIFWLEGGDHDFEEIASVCLLRQNEPVTLTYTGHELPDHGNLGPVGPLKLTTQIEHLLGQVEDLLPPTDFRHALLKQVREAYHPGVTLLDAFARMMRALFPKSGLVFIDAGDPRLKRLAAPLFRREIDDHTTAHDLLLQTSDRLESVFHAQVRTRPTNLFLVDESGRHPLDVEDGRFTLRDRDVTFTREALHELLQEAPERFSPNVVLRPVMQDLLLPTAAYVGGPGEVAYFAQFKPIYDWAEVPMPVVYPRASVSFVESKVMKVLDRYGLSVADLGGDMERLFQDVVVQEMAVDVEGIFRDAGQFLHTAVNGLKPEIEQVDRTLIKAAEATRAALMKEMDRLKGRVLRAEKQHQDVVRAQIEKAEANLYPGGKPQERVVSVLYFLNKYGPGFLAEIAASISLDTSTHQVIEV